MDCGEVIHRFSGVFSSSCAANAVLYTVLLRSLKNLSTFFGFGRWTTLFYPHLRWITVKNGVLYRFIIVFFVLF